MKTKESIKSKVDQLNTRELRIVERLIDSLKSRKKSEVKKLWKKNRHTKRSLTLLAHRDWFQEIFKKNGKKDYDPIL